MKLIPFTVSALLLSVSLSAHAGLDEVVKLIANNPKASFDVSTKTTNEPIEIDVSVDGKTIASATAIPEEFVNGVRGLVAAKTITSSEYTYVVNWESMSLVQNDTSFSVYDLLADIKDHQQDPVDAAAGGTMGGDLSEDMKPLSVVGPYVSYRTSGDDYYPGAAHPNEWDSISTVDARKIGNVADASINLLDLVQESSLVRAIKADTAVNKLVRGRAAKALKSARTIEQVNDAMMEGLQKHCLSFPGFENQLNSFAVYDYDTTKNLVSIRIPLVAAAHVCQAEAKPVQLGLLVNPLVEFELLLREQAKNNDGLLMKNVKK